MSISPRFLDEVRSRLTLSDIIGKRIKVTRAGREYKACCPFHKEKTPSFTINDQKGFYHCFGCGAHGDVIGFTMQYDNLSFPEAVEGLASQAGLQVPQSSPQEIQKAKEQKNIYQLIEDTARWFEARLYDPANQTELDYLLKRGLGRETLQAFRLGFAPSDGDALRKHLLSLEYTESQMIEAGVVKPSSRGGDPYSFFRERIMFPVADKRGRVVAFGGRILPDHMRAPDRGDFTPPKYINSSDNPVFHKGSILYSESLARGHVFEMRKDAKQETLGAVLVVEGYMDVIACAQAGFKGAVAPMGTALTEDQIMALWKILPQEPGEVSAPILCFDGDNAGRRAAERAAERVLPLLAPGKSVQFAFLPEGEDPDSLIKAGGAGAFEAVIAGGMPLIDFIYAKYTSGRDFKTPEARSGLKKALMGEIAQIAHQDVQSHYKNLINKRFSDEFFASRNNSYGGHNARGHGGGSRNKSGPAVSLRAPSINKKAQLERILLAGVINHPVIFENIEEELGGLPFSVTTHDALRNHILNVFIESVQSDDALTLTRENITQSLSQAGLDQELGSVMQPALYATARFVAPEYDQGDVVQKWRVFYEELMKLSQDDHIGQDWRALLANEDGQDEERLMRLMQNKRNEIVQ